MRLLSAFALAPTLLGLNGCLVIDAGFARFNRDFHFSYPLSQGGHLSVDGFNGSIEVTPWNQATVDISGTKYAPSQSEADAMTVGIDHTATAVSVHVARQYDWHGNRGVRFEIKVPRGTVLDRLVTSNANIHALDGMGPSRFKSSNGNVEVENFHGALDIETSNGRINLDGVDGDVTARSSNGRVRADAIRGSIDAETSNSSIHAALLSLDREVRAETRNGAIDLTLPGALTQNVRAKTSNSSVTIRLGEPANARISARTSNSSVTSEFDARVHGDLRRNEMEGTIGNGGPLLELSSSNGAIKITHQ